MRQDMTKKIIMGPYFKYDEDEDWMSTEGVIDGTVRVIEGELCYSEEITLFLDQDEYDIVTQRNVSTKKVIAWVPYDSTQ